MLMGSSPYPKCLFLFLLHACLLLILSSTKESSGLVQRPGRGLITATCNRTTSFNLCIETLESDPRSFKSDVKGLALISLEKSLTKTNELLDYCVDLFKDPVLYDRLYGTCIEELRPAVEQDLPGAISALKSNKYGDSKLGADEAVRHAHILRDKLITRKLPFLVFSELVGEMCSLASVIVSTLQ